MKRTGKVFGVIISLISLLTGVTIASLAGGGIFDSVKNNEEITDKSEAITNTSATYWMDVNGVLDGIDSGYTCGYGNFDVYIDGNIAARGVEDFYSTDMRAGQTYEIKNIQVYENKSFDGVAYGALSGTVTGNISVSLIFNSITWDCHAADSFAGGSGTAKDPYQISSAKELAHLAVISQEDSLTGQHFKLTANIDLRGYLWTGIGNRNLDFKGVFDGNYYRIYGMSIVSSDSCVGLFAFINSSSAEIKNLFLIDSIINARVASASTSVGGVCGFLSNGKITNCVLDNVKINSSDNYDAGGIVGYADNGTISNCIFQNGSITGGHVAGIAYTNYSGNKIVNCSVINTTLQSSNINNIYSIALTEAKQACYGEVLAICSDNTTKFIKEMYDTNWSDWVYSPSLNGGYPVQSVLLNVGGIASDSTAVYNRLKELGFKA